MASIVGDGDDSATQTDFIAVKNHRLTRRDRPLGLAENYIERIGAQPFQYAVLIWLPVANLGPAG